ncbi:hypothetical protein HPY86_00635 [candidate division WOR-3 bacterium]|nr:hypothetical protein [candidate division WOR-3 bacterium]
MARIKPVVLFLFLATVARGADLWRTVWEADVKYHNNIFLFSPSDIEVFRQRENPARFPYKTLDDVDVTVSGQLAWMGTKGFEPQLGLKVHQFIMNSEKSYGLVTCRIKQDLGKVGTAKLSLVWMPNYLIRYYRDNTVKSAVRYAACRFSEYLFGFDFERQFGPFTLQPEYRFETDDYIAPFDYYDTRAHRTGISIDWCPWSNFMLSGEYRFKWARAKGPTPDISYDEQQIGFQVASRPRRFNRFAINAGYNWSYRRYTATEDETHAGRIDEIQEITVGAEYRLKPVTLSFTYQLEWREVSSPYQNEIDEIKNYRASAFSFGARLPLKIGAGAKAQKGKKGGER